MLSALESPYLLVPASLIPLLLLPCGPQRPLLRTLLHLNKAGLAMAFLLALTYPGRAVWGPFSREGIRMGLLVIARLNLISIVLLRMVVSMGPGRIDAALARTGMPENLRVLLLLTMRGVFILAERTAAALRAIRLRAPRLRGILKWRAFAYLLASSLLQSAGRSERMMLAMRCRGGLAGFAQVPPLSWHGRDTALCLCFALSIAALGVLGNGIR